MGNAITPDKEQQDKDVMSGKLRDKPKGLANKLTWREIKDLANSLTDEQLQQEVKYWTDSEGGSIGDANVLDEKYVSDGATYAPASEVLPKDINIDSPVFPKGTVMLWIL